MAIPVPSLIRHAPNTNLYIAILKSPSIVTRLLSIWSEVGYIYSGKPCQSHFYIRQLQWLYSLLTFLKSPRNIGPLWSFIPSLAARRPTYSPVDKRSPPENVWPQWTHISGRFSTSSSGISFVNRWIGQDLLACSGMPSSFVSVQYATYV